MPIIGLNLDFLEAAKESDDIKGNINISSTPKIESIEKTDVDVPGLTDVLSIKFRFTTKFEPKVGYIIIGGELLYKTDNIKKVIDEWKKEKRLEKKVAVEILNTIFRKCLTKSIEISDDLRLPPPLQFPVVKSEKPKDSEYIA